MNRQLERPVEEARPGERRYPAEEHGALSFNEEDHHHTQTESSHYDRRADEADCIENCIAQRCRLRVKPVREREIQPRQRIVMNDIFRYSGEKPERGQAYQ